ncbi:MAG: MarR family transcriptional regulator [Lachnospiraceae bacterium]|nr:MarR family transcriptional regulator [Lachnospiraceae bacterium]
MHELRIYFKKIHNQLEAGFNKEFKKHGLTSTQLDVLLYLSRENGRENTLSDIAAHFDVKHTSVIHVLKLLEQKGFIRKSTAAGTRSKPILLTDSGKQLGEQLILEMEQKSPLLDEIMFAGLSEDDKQVLKKMLHQIYQNLKSDAFKTFRFSDFENKKQERKNLL